MKPSRVLLSQAQKPSSVSLLTATAFAPFKAQQRNLAALSATNEEFRRRLALLRRNYVELATTILAQLEQFDQATRHALRDHDHDAATQSDDANLVALAHRLKPEKEFSPGNEGTPKSDNAA